MVLINFANKNSIPGDPNSVLSDVDVNSIKDAVNSKADSDHTHNTATTSAAGFMSAGDKTKLDGITGGAGVGSDGLKAAYAGVVPRATLAEADAGASLNTDGSPAAEDDRRWTPERLDRLVQKRAVASRAAIVAAIMADTDLMSTLADAILRNIGARGAATPGGEFRFDLRRSGLPGAFLSKRILDIADAGQYLGGAAGPKAVTTGVLETARRYREVDGDGDVVLDMATGQNFQINVVGNTTIRKPVGGRANLSGRIRVVHNGLGTPAWTISVAGDAGIVLINPPITFTTGYGAETILQYRWHTDTIIELTFVRNTAAGALPAPVVPSPGTITATTTPGTVGETHTVTGATYSAPAGAVVTYKWYRDGTTQIATTADYIPQPTDGAHTIEREIIVTNPSGGLYDSARTPAISIAAFRSALFAAADSRNGVPSVTLLANHGTLTAVPGQVFVACIEWQGQAMASIAAEGCTLSTFTSGSVAASSPAGKTLTALGSDTRDTDQRTVWVALEGFTGDAPTFVFTSAGAMTYAKIGITRITGYNLASRVIDYASQPADDSLKPTVAVVKAANGLSIYLGNRVKTIETPPTGNTTFLQVDPAGEALDLIFGALGDDAAYSGNIVASNDAAEASKQLSVLTLAAI